MCELSKTLHFFVKNDEKHYTLDVNVRDDEEVIPLSTIVELIPKDQYSDDITFKTHEFEVFDKMRRVLSKNCESNHLVVDRSSIRVKIKEFSCFIQFYDNYGNRFDIGFRFNEWRERFKLLYALQYCRRVTNQIFLQNYSIEIFDEKSKQFVGIKPSDEDIEIPNRSLIRIMKTNVDDIDANRDIVTPFEQNSNSDSSLSDKLIKQLNSLYINSTDEEEKEKSSNGANGASNSFGGSDDQMSKENKTIDGNKSKKSSVDSSDNTIDLYLSSIINKCLNNRPLSEIRPAFWKSVSYSLANDYKQSVDENECRKRFKRLLKRYIEVMKNSKNEIEANVSLKCFKLLNSMDLSLFLESDHQLVSDLRYKLWNNTRNGFKGQTSDQHLIGNEFQSNRESNQQITEYYLSSVVSECLNNKILFASIPTIHWADMFWRTVTTKLITDYNLKIIDKNNCQMMFSEVIQKYIRVLKRSQNLIEAENSFKSFHLLNSMDLYLFLTPEVNQLIVQLRDRLWNVSNQTSITSFRAPKDSCVPTCCPSCHNPYFTIGYPTQQLSHHSIKTNFIDPIALKEQLLKCSSIEGQMSVFFDRVLLTEDDIQKRNELKSVLEIILKIGSGMDCVLHTYGSTANTLGFRNSDIDLFIELKNENNFHNKFGYEKAMSYLKEFRTTLSHNLNLMIAKPVDSRRCPIIRIDFNYLRNSFPQKTFVYKTLGIVCDLSLTNGLGVINTKLIRLYSRLESSFHQLAVILRYWAKINGFIDGLNGLTSYALTQLVVFFCQSISPPIIPSLDQLKRLSLDSVVIDGIECRFCDDLNMIPKSKNKDSIIDLLKKFFKFYSNFDFTTQMICPKIGHSLHKFWKSVSIDKNRKNAIDFKMTPIICIEDPFDCDYNLTANTKYEVFDRFLEYIKHIDLKSDMIFSQNKSGNGFNDWGISKIITKFDPTNGYQPIIGRHIIHPTVRQILETPKTTAQSMALALITEYFDLVLLLMEKVFRVLPVIKITTELSENIYHCVEFTVERKGFFGNVFNSNDRRLVKKGLKINQKRDKTQQMNDEIRITNEIIGKFKDKPIDESPVKFRFCLFGYNRLTGPYIELKTLEFSPEESNVDKTLKGFFRLIQKAFELK